MLALLGFGVIGVAPLGWVLLMPAGFFFLVAASRYALDSAAARRLGAVESEREAHRQIWAGKLASEFKIVEAIIHTHAERLRAKRRQLIRFDEYGVPNATAWEQHKRYFLKTVVPHELQKAGRTTDVRLLLNSDPPSPEEFPGLDPYAVLHPKIEYEFKAYDSIETVAASGGQLRPALDNLRAGVHAMSGPEFERACQEVLEETGWSVRPTGRGGDQGVDLVASKPGLIVAIQCKCYRGTVGNAAVQEVFAAKQHISADHAAVVTSSSFTRAARELAMTTGVHLLHFEELPILSELVAPKP